MRVNTERFVEEFDHTVAIEVAMNSGAVYYIRDTRAIEYMHTRRIIGHERHKGWVEHSDRRRPNYDCDNMSVRHRRGNS